MADHRRSSDDALQDISRSIGALQANYETATRDRQEMRHDIKNLIATLQPLASLPDRVGVLEQEAENNRKLKNRGLGILAGMGLAAGTVGASFKHVLDKITGPGGN